MAEAFTELYPGVGGSKMDDRTVPNTAAGGTAHRSVIIPGDAAGLVQAFVDESGIVKSQVKDASAGVALAQLIENLNPDAFSRLRVSEPTSLFEVTHQYDLSPDQMGTLESGGSGGSVTLSSPHAVLAVGSSAGHVVRHRSHRYMIYQPGKSQMIRMTGRLGDGTARAWMGYGDADDGVFLERTSTGYSIRLRSSVIAGQLVDRVDWNLDALDGAGPSGKTLVEDDAQHLVIDIQWLGVGTVMVGLNIDRVIHYVHRFDFANAISTAYMRTASLPVEWGIESLGVGATMLAICAGVISEGGHSIVGQAFSASLASARALLGAGVRTPLIAIRPAASFASVANHGQIVPRDWFSLVASADNVLLELILNPTSLTAASFAAADSASHTEVDKSATAITGGRVIWSDYISSTGRDLIGGDLESYPLVQRVDGSLDTIVLCGTRIGGAASLFAGLNWIETR